MKKTITLLTLLLTFGISIFAQTFTDNFNDGSFTDGPVWTGDAGIYTINAANELQLMDTDGGSSYLSTPANTIGATTWDFLFHLEFAPSTSNQLKIYLNASAADLSGSLNGYFLQIGASGSDDAIEFRRQNGTASTLILTGTAGSVANEPALARVRVVRDATGNWELFADYTGGTNLVSQGTTFDDTYSSGNFFGVHCKYTSTRKENFFFDDITIDPIVVEPPQIQSITPISNTDLDVQFSEPVTLPSAENVANYIITNLGNPANATLDASDATLVHLTGFSPAFTNGTSYTLNITGVADLTGDTANDSESFTFFEADEIAPFDILINEFMAAPITSGGGINSVEYVELYNRSDKFINLSELQFSDNSSPNTLPNYTMSPNEYIVLTDEGNEYLFASTTVFGFNIALVNGGDNLLLQDQNGQTIHQKIYNSVEVEGGISTELINPDSYCQASNWVLSTDPTGGTPGRENSQFNASPDQTGPSIICVNVESENSIRLLFDEILDETATDELNYDVDNNIGSPTSATLDNAGDAVILNFNTTFNENVIYQITINNIFDCTGNNPIGAANTAQFSNSTIEAGDLIINELLFDAPTGGVDFIEIYNHSNKILPINGLQILEIEEDGDNFVGNIVARCPMLPGDYIALSDDPQSTISSYPLTPNPEGILYVDLPSFDSQGSVYLLGEMQLLGRDTIDKFSYTDDFHNPLLDNTDGVSLERIDFDSPTQDPNNWQSAAESVGWATPAYENSQRFTGTGGSSNKCVNINKEVFSPNGDGYEDFLLLDYDFDTPGYIANVRIFDAKGRQVKQLTNNQLLGTKGFFRWDGDTDDGQKVRIGIYVVWVELFDVNGNVTRCKQPCVVAGQF